LIIQSNGLLLTQLLYANNMLNLAPESWVIDEDWTWPERANLHEYETFVILKKQM